MSYYKLSPSMRRTLFSIAFGKHGCVSQSDYPHQTLKALRDRGLMESAHSAQYGMMWRTTRAGGVVAHLLAEEKEGED